MKVLDLFCGTKSIANKAKEMGHKVFTVDFDPQFKPDLICDILDLTPKMILFIPDMIWASPDCSTFSIASMGHHWTGGDKAYIPKTQKCKQGLFMLEKTVQFICQCKPKVWYIENPQGMMRQLIHAFLVKYDAPAYIQHRVTYCQYGDKRMKPTDIWTNDWNWNPKPRCQNGQKCHEPAPRGSKTGTQGLKNSIERAKIPELLCEEIIRSAEQVIQG